jgi:hypothetical protein
MSALRIVKVMAVVCLGLGAGVFLDFSASAPARGALGASSFVQYQQNGACALCEIGVPLFRCKPSRAELCNGPGRRPADSTAIAS